MNDTEQRSRLQSSPYIISPFPLSTLSSLFLSAGPEPAPIPTTVPFSLSWSHLSSCSSLCQSLSRFHPSLHPPSLPAMDSGEPISSRSCLLFATVNSASRENGLLSSSRGFSFGQLGSFALTLKLLLSACEKGDALCDTVLLDWHHRPVEWFCLAQSRTENTDYENAIGWHATNVDTGSFS